uniref:large conductance mechanosensitive channel protein MscL n=1 Tax=Peterkaempfera griseoplana TaxID=66896 RepID=UPI000ACE7AF7
MFKGFKNFLMRGDVIVVAVGLITALAFSTLIKAFTDFVINPIIARIQGSRSVGLGWQLGAPGNKATYLDIGSFISALIYFVIFMAVVYFLIVAPYKHSMRRRGQFLEEAGGAGLERPRVAEDRHPAAAHRV